MKITLFGATGKTGSYLVDEAIRRDHDVTVFARTGTEYEDVRVRIVRGDLYDKSVLQEAIQGSSAVLSALGPTRMDHPKNIPITRALQCVVEAMTSEQVDRLIAISTGSADADPDATFALGVWLPKVIIERVMANQYKDLVGLERVLRNSGLAWTTVRAAVLTDRPAKRRLNIGAYGRTKHSMTLSRADLAIFMFDQLESDALVHQAPGVSSN